MMFRRFLPAALILGVAWVAGSPLAQESPPSGGRYPALLLPARTALLKAKFGERVAELPVEVGTRVRRGQLLVRLADDLERVARHRASVQLEQAQAELRRMERLHEQQGISDELMEEAQTKVRLAQADLDLAEIRLRERSLRAPFGGVVAERYVDPGTSVVAGESLVRVTALSPLRLETLLPEELLSELQKPAWVEVTLTGIDSVLHLPVQLGTVVVDPASGTFPLRFEIENANERLTPGVSASLRLHRGMLEQP